MTASDDQHGDHDSPPPAGLGDSPSEDHVPGTEHHEHLEVSDLLLGGADEGSGEPGDATMDQLVSDAIGGWRGLFDSSFPSLVFVVVYLVSNHRLPLSLWSAIGAGVVVAVLRQLRGQSMRQVFAGFPLLLLSAWITSRTGKAEDFYLPGLILNAGSAIAFLVSILVGHPLLGYFVGALTGDLTGWREVPEQVKVPLYWSANVAALGTIGLILGWPLTALAAYFSYLVIVKARREAPVPTTD